MTVQGGKFEYKPVQERPETPAGVPGDARTFATGATRSSDAGRYDPEGFLSPLALERFCEYMSKHRIQADGKVRDSDNWQKGMPLVTYMKGMWRHFLHLWQRHRGWIVGDPGAAANIEEDLCAILFNVQGYLHELVKERTQTYGTVAPMKDVPLPEPDWSKVDWQKIKTLEPMPEPGTTDIAITEGGFTFIFIEEDGSVRNATPAEVEAYKKEWYRPTNVWPQRCEVCGGGMCKFAKGVVAKQV